MSQETKYAAELIERFCAPRPVEHASVWAEREFVLNEPKIKGPFTLRGREYLRQMVDAWGPLPDDLRGGTDFITCAGTGIGKTIGNMAGLGFRLGLPARSHSARLAFRKPYEPLKFCAIRFRLESCAMSLLQVRCRSTVRS